MDFLVMKIKLYYSRNFKSKIISVIPYSNFSFYVYYLGLLYLMKKSVAWLFTRYSLSMPPLFKASVALLNRKESINLCLPYLTPWLPCYNDVERFSWGSKKILQWNIIIWNFPLLRGKLLLVYSIIIIDLLRCCLFNRHKA